MKSPLLSIVIANYNYGRYVGEALDSVLGQSCQDFELIVIDGLSSDNSVEVIEKYRNRLAYFVSEKDFGQSDAFNKGFSKAKGRLLTWLNADDVMLPGTIAGLKSAVAKHPDCEWFVGGALWLDPEMKVMRAHRACPFSGVRKWCGHVPVWGPSSFFSRRLLQDVGGVDERFHYTMDSDLWLKFARVCGARYEVAANYAWGLRLHPGAKMSGQVFDGDDQQNPNHPKWDQLKKEHEWMHAGHDVRPWTIWNRMRAISWPNALLSRVDTLLWRGKYYKEIG